MECSYLALCPSCVMQKILKMPLQYTEETHHCRKLDQRLDCEEKLHIAHKCWFKVEERYA